MLYFCSRLNRFDSNKKAEVEVSLNSLVAPQVCEFQICSKHQVIMCR